MRSAVSGLAMVCAVLAVGCGGSTTSTVTAPTIVSVTAAALADANILSFSGLSADAAAVTSYSEAGFTVTPRSGNWQARTTYGNPRPFIQFFTDPGATVVGEALVTLSGPTYLRSVELYSSTTTIPYVIKGLRNGAVVFTLAGTLPNTYGTFRAVSSTNAAQIDALSIAMTNVSPSGGRNPMGFDNVSVGTSPAVPEPTYVLSGSVLDSTSGSGVPGARVAISAGPNIGASTTTDAAGMFQLTGLLGGFVTLGTTATNYLSSTQNLALEANQSVSVSLRRNPMTFPSEPVPSGATVIGFDGLTTNGDAVTTYRESGFIVTASGAPWQAVTTYGHPVPFIQFYAEASTTATGRVDVTAGGAPFTFAWAELYSSTTKIPYTITGTRNGAVVFSTTAELGNTFGNFKQVINGQPASAIDTLTFVLTNPATIRNPVGIDTIVVVK